jgi:outer membrane protein OmpA-like peptidoglycan-associated protein
MKTIVMFLAVLFSISLLGQSAANLKVKVMNFEKSGIAGETVIFESEDKTIKTQGKSGVNGEFRVDLKGGHTYDIYVKKLGTDLKNNQIEIPKLQEGAQYADATLQIFFEMPRQIILENLRFETAKWTIKPSSYSILDEVVQYLKSNPAKKLTINGYTDNRGDENSNLILSQKRAKAVKEFLVRKGISNDRIRTQGYGEDKPISSNDSELGRKKNRRTEIIFN